MEVDLDDDRYKNSSNSDYGNQQIVPHVKKNQMLIRDSMSIRKESAKKLSRFLKTKITSH